MVKVDAEKVNQLIQVNHPHLEQALGRQNYYSYEEALEDLTELINNILKNGV